jgi:hypothetical protein
VPGFDPIAAAFALVVVILFELQRARRRRR